MALNPAPPNADPRGELPTPAADAEEFFHAYSRQLYRYCLGRLGSPEEAEDAVQVTYLNAWQSLRRGTHPLDPRSWLFAIAANVCTTALRTRLRGAKVEVRAPQDFERLPAARHTGDVLVGLDAALKALPARQREALLLRDWRGLSYEEIAAELESSQPAVETLLFRARQAVATSLGRPAARRAPLRSALPALVLWPSGLKSLSAGLKSSLGNLASALPGGAVAAKAAGVAIGVIAPLVAYGVVASGVGREGASRAPAPAGSPVEVRFAPTPREARPPVHRPARVPSAVASAEAAREAAGARTGRAGEAPASPNGAVKGATTHETGSTETPPAASDPQAPDEPGTDQTPETPPAPGEPETPSPSEEPGAEKTVICHATGSKKNPSVTILVSESAVEAHLAHGDVLGACVG